MINTLIDKAKGFLIAPVEMFQQSRTDEPAAVFTYFVALLLVNAIFSALIAAVALNTLSMFAGLNLGIPLPAIVFVAALFGGFIFTLVFSAWLHLWVYIFGGRKGFMQTLNAMIYGHTPRLLFGWIPFIGFIFTLWSLVLNIIGIRELQEIDTVKATIAVAIAVMIPVILIVLAFAYFVIASPSVVTSLPTGPMPSLR